MLRKLLPVPHSSYSLMVFVLSARRGLNIQWRFQFLETIFLSQRWEHGTVRGSARKVLDMR